jgi:hypothetical protein
MKQQLDASQTARDVEVLLIEAGWIQAADKRNGEPAPFLQGSPKLFVINAIHGGTEYAIGGGEDQAHRTPMDAARYLIGMIQPKEAEPVEAVAPVTYTPAAEPAPAPDTEAVNLAAENERLRARIAELESASYIDRDERPDAVEEVVGPLEALKAKIDAVRAGKAEMSPDELIEMHKDNPPGAAQKLEDAVRALKGEARRKLSELLNVELAELKNNRGMAGQDLEREQQIEYLLGLFTRLGEI